MADKKTGAELIAQERQEQIEKHGRTIKQDVKLNTNDQLTFAATVLMQNDYDGGLMPPFDYPPKGWDKKIWANMLNKPYKDRLIIAGALVAAEIDRLQNI